MKLPKIEDILIAYGVYHENDELEKADIIAAMKEYALLVIARCTEKTSSYIDTKAITSVKDEIE